MGNVAGARSAPWVRDRDSKAPRGDFELRRSVIFREDAAPTGLGCLFGAADAIKIPPPTGRRPPFQPLPGSVTPRPVFRTPWFKTISA